MALHKCFQACVACVHDCTHETACIVCTSHVHVMLMFKCICVPLPPQKKMLVRQSRTGWVIPFLNGYKYWYKCLHCSVGCTCFRTPYISSSFSLLFLKHHFGENSEGLFCFLRNGTRTHTHTNIKNFFDCSTRFLIAVWYGLESHYLMFHVSGHNIWLFKNQRKPVTQIKLQTFLWHCYILVEEVMVVVGDRLFCQFSSWFEGEGCLSHCNNTEPWRLRSLSTDIDFALVLCTLLNRTLSLTRSQGNRIFKKYAYKI